MKKSKVILFTSPTCPHCASAKKDMGSVMAERSDVEYSEYSTGSPQGKRLAGKFNIMSVPTFIIQGPGFLEPIGLVGGQSKSVLNKYIDVSLGLRDIDEPKQGLFSRLKEGIKIGKFNIKF